MELIPGLLKTLKIPPQYYKEFAAEENTVHRIQSMRFDINL
jgi:hypothetical protein